MIKTKDISFSYSEAKQFRFPDLDLNQGDQALILGNSGCGKSTYMNILGALNTNFRGSVEIANQDIQQLRNSKLDQFRGSNIGIIFQESNLVQSLTLMENLKLRLKLARKKIQENQIIELLKELGIDALIHQMPSTLSIGERQRSNIALALITEPKVLLADEPTSALDDYHARQVIQLLKNYSAKYQTTLLIITHDNRVKKDFEYSITL